MNDPNLSSFSEANPVFGTPKYDSEKFPGKQSYENTCAVRCQEFIIEQFTGKDYDERLLVKEALEKGWYDPRKGTAFEAVGNLLELHGIPVNRCIEATQYHLASELSQGHKVIIGVNSQDLWNKGSILNSLSHLINAHNADHVLIVSGIEAPTPDNVSVIVSDPGTGEAAASYSLKQFLEAWKDSHFMMVSTKNSPPGWKPEMTSLVKNHISQTLGASYDSCMHMAQESLSTRLSNELVPDQSPSARLEINPYYNSLEPALIWEDNKLNIEDTRNTQILNYPNNSCFEQKNGIYIEHESHLFSEFDSFNRSFDGVRGYSSDVRLDPPTNHRFNTHELDLNSEWEINSHSEINNLSEQPSACENNHDDIWKHSSINFQDSHFSSSIDPNTFHHD